MSVLTLLAFAGLILALSFTFSLRRRPEPFDPGSFPFGTPPEPKTAQAEAKQAAPASSKAIHLGGGLFWEPEAHPNPHLLIVGGSGREKTCTIRHLACRLKETGANCAIFDFHGDLDCPGFETFPVSMDSEYGVNPLQISPEPDGGGPDPQRFEVVHQLRTAFKPMGSLQAAMLDDCVASVYRNAGIDRSDPRTWLPDRSPHFGDLERELQRRIESDPKDTRARGLKAKLTAAFDFGIFSRPQIPALADPTAGGLLAVRVDLSRLPLPLQLLASDALLQQIFRARRLGVDAGLAAINLNAKSAQDAHLTQSAKKTQRETSTAPPATDEPETPITAHSANLPAAPRLHLLIDEAKLCMPEKKDSPMAALNRIASEGRKFGLALIVSSQCAAHLSRDVLANTFTKIVMKTDRTEAAAAARRFQIDRDLLETLQDPGHALVHFASEADWKKVRIDDGISK